MGIRGTVGDNIRRFRLERGVSQESLALDAEIDRTYVSGLERGKRNPSVELLEKIGAVLGVTVAELVTPHKPTKQKNLIRGVHASVKRSR